MSAVSCLILTTVSVKPSKETTMQGSQQIERTRTTKAKRSTYDERFVSHWVRDKLKRATQDARSVQRSAKYAG